MKVAKHRCSITFVNRAHKKKNKFKKMKRKIIIYKFIYHFKWFIGNVFLKDKKLKNGEKKKIIIYKFIYRHVSGPFIANKNIWVPKIDTST